jgi:hypothetical protein
VLCLKDETAETAETAGTRGVPQACQFGGFGVEMMFAIN